MSAATTPTKAPLPADGPIPPDPSVTALATLAATPETTAILTPSWKERLLGVEGTSRRAITFYITAFLVATTVRQACFSPYVFGTYLLKNLAPVERESTRWHWILLVRAWDLVLGAAVWRSVKGGARRDGALFGGLIAAVSRVSLYMFEHSYFLLTSETVATLLLIDIVSLASAFSLLPILLPHSIPAHPTFSAFTRLQRNPELLVNLALAAGLATAASAFVSYAIEHGFGGQAFVKRNVSQLYVPSMYASDTMSTKEMLDYPSVPVPSMRSFLSPLSMPTHLAHTLIVSLLTIPLVSIFPGLSPAGIATVTYLLVAPPSTILFWDVLPVSALGALGVGSFLALRAALSSAIVSWVLEELRDSKWTTKTKVEVVVVDESTDQVVAIAEATVRQRKVNPPASNGVAAITE